MRVRLLGTGASDGWPNAWCVCASCRAARAQGVLRGQSCALVDDRLLIELGHDGVRAAAASGALAGVEVVLVTHAHPDHHAAPAWMWRGWAAGRRPLTLLAPPGVLAAAAPQLDDRVTAVAVHPGDVVDVAGYEVRALPATHAGPDVGPAVLYDLTGPDGKRLLWATDTGVLGGHALALAADRAYDAVLLDLTSAHLPAHHDLTSWPRQVAELRRRGAIVDGTAVHAVHLGHDNPPPDELDTLLAGWGASALRDGQLLELGDAHAASTGAAPDAARVLVLGGARSGKSAWAEQRLAAEPAVSYLATAAGRPGDAAWVERVRVHRERRPASWRTVESVDVARELAAGHRALLVDDLGGWLTRVVDEADAWTGPSGAVHAACDALVAAWRDCPGTVVLVVPEVGSGVVPATAAGGMFRDLLGALTTRLAAASDAVVQVVAGLPRVLR